jgi:hypothetical protein
MDMTAVKLQKLGAWSDRSVFIPRRSAQEYLYSTETIYAAGSCGSGALKSRQKPPFRGPGNT